MADYVPQDYVPQKSDKFTPENAQALTGMAFDAAALALTPLPYKKLDQLVFDLLLGVR